LSGFNHFDDSGKAHMVNVGSKSITKRKAVATGNISVSRDTIKLIKAGSTKKGDVLGVARIAAIQATKQTSQLIPLCHPVSISGVSVEFSIDEAIQSVECTVTAESIGLTGVEMEALSGVSIGLLTIYDMCKAIDKGMNINSIRLLEKTGGKSGTWKGN